MRGTGLAFLAATALLASGCGEIAYKTGAGADALQSDQQSCKAAGGGAAAYKACMNGKGWAIADLDAGASGTYIPPKPVPGAPPPMAPAETPWMAAPTNPMPGMAPPPAPAAATPAADPTRPVPVTAWVKFGSGDPKDAMDACVASLGPAHAPDKTHKTITVALLSCMRDHGWRGL